MSEREILMWFIGAVAFAAGFSLGHQRGQIAGIRWAIKRLDEPNPASEIDGIEDMRRLVGGSKDV